jgi:acyl dehydratase
MASIDLTIAKGPSLIGQDLGVSPWFTVGQDKIDGFAELTHDPNPIHIDPGWAKANTPMGGTIGHGFYTLAMLTHLSEQVGIYPSDCTYALNYGLNKVRWISPVPSGSRIRARFALKDFAHKVPGDPSKGWLMTTECTVEIEGQDKPAMIAEWLGLFFA